MNPLDILKRTPKTNCGECGYQACLAFAANVARSGEDPQKCPYINLDGLELSQQDGTELDKLAQEHDLQLIRHLQSKINNLDFNHIAPRLGISTADDNKDVFVFSYLGQQVRLGHHQLLIDGKEPEDPRDQILLYNYIHSGGSHPPCGEWVGLESLPNSISKVRTLATYCEERLANLFTGKTAETISQLCKKIAGSPLHESSASAGVIIPVLPRLPQQVLFWEAEPEDGFEAKAKVLFDANVLNYLDLESLVFSAERLADRLILLASNPS
ncbi:MAG: DUF3786 domain-containing protein [Desulfobulbaceae bacterium]|nr:DUF3786 domain-containing protein [Desulfobulbaceae bacterium]